MPDLTPEMRQRGYDFRHNGALANLRNELDEITRALADAVQAAEEGRADTLALRRLANAAGEARVHGGALAELAAVDFLLTSREH